MSISDRTMGDKAFARARVTLDEALARNELPSCALDARGMAQQKDRHARLAPSLRAIDRREYALRFSFAPGLDRDALAEMIAIERQCCPFFEFAFDAEERTLTVTVAGEEMLPALDAIASQLGADRLTKG